MDYKRCLEIQRPYLGKMIGRYTDWTPLNSRITLFETELDKKDPWQFTNVLVR
jgi:homospermidine synthase